MMTQTLNKRFMKSGFVAMALVIGASAVAATASADDNRGRYGNGHNDGHGGPAQVHVQPVKVVVVQQPSRQQPVRGSLFDRLDINNDRAVTEWEFSSRYGNGRQAMRTFNRMDSNRTGKLSVQEVAQGRGLLSELKIRG